MMKLNMEYCADKKTIVFIMVIAHSSHSTYLLNGNIIIIHNNYPLKTASILHIHKYSVGM